MTRRYGRAATRTAAGCGGATKISTFVAGLRTSGLAAPLVVDRAMNGDIFRAYVEQILAPTLGRVFHAAIGAKIDRQAAPYREHPQHCNQRDCRHAKAADGKGFQQEQMLRAILPIVCEGEA